jgi:hypothetical protein
MTTMQEKHILHEMKPVYLKSSTGDPLPPRAWKGWSPSLGFVLIAGATRLLACLTEPNWRRLLQRKGTGTMVLSKGSPPIPRFIMFELRCGQQRECSPWGDAFVLDALKSALSDP